MGTKKQILEESGESNHSATPLPLTKKKQWLWYCWGSGWNKVFSFFVKFYFKRILLIVFLQLIHNILFPDLLKNLFDQCCARIQKNRPTMSDVVKTLSVSICDLQIVQFQWNTQLLCLPLCGNIHHHCLSLFLQDFSLPRLLVSSEFTGQNPHELSCKTGEVILLISKAFSL